MTNDRLGWLHLIARWFYHTCIRNPVIFVRYVLWMFIQFGKELGLGLLGLLLKEKTKRTILIASLYRVIESQRGNAIVLERLNQKLHLVERTEALIFPTEYFANIWDKEKIIQYVKEHDQHSPQSCSEKIARLAPRFLLYGSVNKLLKDINDVISLGDTQQPA